MIGRTFGFSFLVSGFAVGSNGGPASAKSRTSARLNGFVVVTHSGTLTCSLSDSETWVLEIWLWTDAACVVIFLEMSSGSLALDHLVIPQSMRMTRKNPEIPIARYSPRLSRNCLKSILGFDFDLAISRHLGRCDRC